MKGRPSRFEFRRHIVVWAICSVQFLATTAGAQIVETINPVRYEIKQSIEVTNHDVSPLGFLELNLPIPEEWREQRIGAIKIQGDDPFRVTDVDALGKVARVVYPPNLPGPGEARTLAISYWIESKEVRTDKARLAKQKFGAYDTSSNEYRLYTRSENLLEADDPGVAAAARRLREEHVNPYRFAEAVYQFVMDHLEYTAPTQSHGAAQALKVGKGDCGQYTAMFVALCRAGGVPARPVAGRWAEGEDNWHCWAEFKLPGVGWLPVDPTAGDTIPDQREYCFCNMDNKRVALVKAYNQAFNTNRGTKSLGFMQVGCWIWHPAPGSTGDKMSVKFHARGERVR